MGLARLPNAIGRRQNSRVLDEATGAKLMAADLERIMTLPDQPAGDVRVAHKSEPHESQ